MIETVVDLLPWILPPILGSIIGYVTNAVAIRMLFRPFREWRVIGIRVPFTPGIIPRQRYKLAENIAEMVSRELLTDDAVLRRTESESFQSSLNESVAGITTKVLETDLRTMTQQDRSEPDSNVRPIVFDILRQTVVSEGFSRLVRFIIYEGLHYLTSRPVSDLLEREPNIEVSARKIHEWITEDSRFESIMRRVEEWLTDRVARNEKIDDMIPESAASAIVDLVDRVYDPAFSALLRWLRTPEMRSELERRGRYLVRDILDRLTALQKLFITATQYDRQLESNMPDIVDDALEAVESIAAKEETKERLREAVWKELVTIRNSTLSELDDRYDVELQTKIAGVIRKLGEAFRSKGGEKIVTAVLSYAEEQAEQSTIRDIIERFTTIDDISDKLSVTIVDGIKNALTRDGKEGDLGSKLVTEGGLRTIGSILGVDTSVKEKLDAALTRSVVELINRKVPEILSSLDVESLVVEKVNSLNVEQVEGLLMRVIHRHLKWINVFGAILGFIIGMLQIFSQIVL